MAKKAGNSGKKPAAQMDGRRPDGKFAKGNVPTGHRPKGSTKPTFKTILDNLPDDMRTFQVDGKVLTADEMAMAQLLSAMANGEQWAIREFMSWRVGKPTQAIEHIESNDIELTDDEIDKALSDALRIIGGEAGEACA